MIISVWSCQIWNTHTLIVTGECNASKIFVLTPHLNIVTTSTWKIKSFIVIQERLVELLDWDWATYSVYVSIQRYSNCGAFDQRIIFSTEVPPHTKCVILQSCTVWGSCLYVLCYSTHRLVLLLGAWHNDRTNASSCLATITFASCIVNDFVHWLHTCWRQCSTKLGVLRSFVSAWINQQFALRWTNLRFQPILSGKYAIHAFHESYPLLGITNDVPWSLLGENLLFVSCTLHGNSRGRPCNRFIIDTDPVHRVQRWFCEISL